MARKKRPEFEIVKKYRTPDGFVIYTLEIEKLKNGLTVMAVVEERGEDYRILEVSVNNMSKLYEMVKDYFAMEEDLEPVNIKKPKKDETIIPDNI